MRDQDVTGVVVSGLSSLLELDMSNNFLETIPIAALESLKNLKFLNLGSNKIKVTHLSAQL